MQRLGVYFFRGLVVIAPLFLTIYALYFIFSILDGLFFPGIPGVGVVITLLIVFGTGFLATNIFTRRVVELVDRLMNRVPIIKLLYGSVKDLTDAFVGEKRRFDRPVRLQISPDSETSVLGFLTRDELEFLDVSEFVAVYVPQSYNFAGNLLVAPSSQVHPVVGDATEIMTFIVSGGVSGPRHQPLPDNPLTGRPPH